MMKPRPQPTTRTVTPATPPAVCAGTPHTCNRTHAERHHECACGYVWTAA